jgi:hypothetical protein
MAIIKIGNMPIKKVFIYRLNFRNLLIILKHF